MGDSSDNLKGVSGIGPKGASKLINTYGSLENIYNNINEITGATKTKLENDQDSAFLCKKLATIKTNVNIEELEFDPINLDPINIKKFLTKYEMFSLINKFNFLCDINKENETKEEKPNITILKK
ncbi:hypothetical protein JIY74_26835 [Vibrio harveyi]|nr:hypothetical protein [Vibrio harveyi]